MQKVIKAEIKDLEGVKHFSIRLFEVMEGLDFIDRFVGSKDRSIKNYLSDLLPLATLLDANGQETVDVMSLEKAKTYFQNPLAVIELAMAVFEHQKVFMKESKVFQPYLAALGKSLDFRTLD